MIIFNPRDFGNSQLYELGDEIRIILRGVPETNEVIRRQSAKLDAAVSDLGSALGRDRASEFVTRKQQIDELRDDLVIGYGKVVASYAERSPIPAKKEAAQLLLDILQRRKERFYSKDYETNSAELKLFFADMDRSAAAQQALVTLAMADEWYLPLKQSNADFEAVVLAESEAAAKDDDPTLLSPAKRRLNAKLRLVLGNLEDYAEDGVQPYTDLLEQITNRITAVRSVALSRKTRAAGEGTAESEPTAAV
jgi:hypothetical protein